MTAEQGEVITEWRVDDTEGTPERPQAVLAGPGRRFILHKREHAAELAALLNAQAAALAGAAQLGKRYDCGKSDLQKTAMVPCLNLPQRDECYACQIAKARFERNSFCICDDDDELPTAPADYCPVHGNTYKYVLQEEARLVEALRARAAAVERAETAEARVERLEAALQGIAAMASESGQACSEVARTALE